MKYLLLALLGLSIVGCASSTRDPASTTPEDVSEGVNADYYGQIN